MLSIARKGEQAAWPYLSLFFLNEQQNEKKKHLDMGQIISGCENGQCTVSVDESFHWTDKINIVERDEKWKT